MMPRIGRVRLALGLGNQVLYQLYKLFCLSVSIEVLDDIGTCSQPC
jgi:hypothetical protein